MYFSKTSDSIRPASDALTLETSAPSNAAASIWRSAQAHDVNRNTAGAVTITDKPCG